MKHNSSKRREYVALLLLVGAVGAVSASSHSGAQDFGRRAEGARLHTPPPPVVVSRVMPVAGRSQALAELQKFPAKQQLSNATLALNKQLAQSAPYALDSNAGQSMKNIVFRLALTNQSTTQTESATSLLDSDDAEQWTFVSANGTSLGARVNFNLRRLLDTLNQNNFTSEVNYDENNNGYLNITITSGHAGATTNLQRYNASPIDELILEELLEDAKRRFAGNFAPVAPAATQSPATSDLTTAAAVAADLSTANSVLRDNHRLESARPQRTRSSGIASSGHLLDLISAPPIRAAIEVVAENYTARKIADEANVFAIRLLEQLNIERLGSRNVIQAPFAVYQGLALLLTGAMGDTAKEMDMALLGSQSTYVNTRLTHDQDRGRLLASLGDVLRTLHGSSVRQRAYYAPSQTGADANSKQSELIVANDDYYNDDQNDDAQHLIVANNLLFSPAAFEVSSEFRSAIHSYYNHTALTKVEVGSTEAIQLINAWVRRATRGLVPAILDKHSTFDEFNVMTLLSTAWLSQQWQDQFERVAAPMRTQVRLKAGHAPGLPRVTQARALSDSQQQHQQQQQSTPAAAPAANLLEFIDDNRVSHFVDYIRSVPTRNIRHYHSSLNGFKVDVVVVPFADSNHRLVTLTPISVIIAAPGNITRDITPTEPPTGSSSSSSSSSLLLSNMTSGSSQPPNNVAGADSAEYPPQSGPTETDASMLSRLIAALAQSPRKAMRSLWNIVSPEIITRNTIKSIQLARQRTNSSQLEEHIIEARMPPYVELSVPLIRSEADASISAALNHLGLVNAFDPNQANFIGINGHPFNYYKLHLSNVLTKTQFNLNERGINYEKTIRTLEPMRLHNFGANMRRRQPRPDAVRRSADGVPASQQQTGHAQQQQQQQLQGNSLDSNMLHADSPTRLEFIDEVKLNKPFMYLICDVKSRLVLYTGVLRNPTQEGA